MADVAACSSERNVVEMDLEMIKMLNIRSLERKQCAKKCQELVVLVGWV